MGFYLSVLNDQMKLAEENDAIGIIICKTKDKTVVEYALKSTTLAHFWQPLVAETSWTAPHLSFHAKTSAVDIQATKKSGWIPSVLTMLTKSSPHP